MELEEIRARVANIRKRAEREDDEACHVEQDALYRDLLQSIANGEMTLPAAVVASSLALQVEDIEFSRWSA